MKLKLAANHADQNLSNLLLAPWQTPAISLVSPLPSTASLVATVDADSTPPSPLATPVRMKCVLVL